MLPRQRIHQRRYTKTSRAGLASFLFPFLNLKFTKYPLYCQSKGGTIISSFYRMGGVAVFGYVRPDTAALRVREFTWYRGVYCGLCRAMGQITGQASRLTLSYDLTFLALVRSILTDPFHFTPHHCAVHPLHARLIADPHPALDYTAAAAAYLTEAKRLDDWQDERGLSRVPPLLLTPLTRPMQSRATRNLPETAELPVICAGHLAKLAEKEKENCPSPDEMAQCFGELLGELFATGLPETESRIARAIGVGTGRFLYLCDAIDDLAEDTQKARYNPLSTLWGELTLEEAGVPSPPVKDAFVTATGLDLTKLGHAVELLPETPLTEIVRNIVYLGMPNMVRKILAGTHERFSLCQHSERALLSSEEGAPLSTNETNDRSRT